MIAVKSAREIEIMREAGRITGLALAKAGAAVEPGITTGELDAIAYKVITEHGAKPSFLGYRKFPASICVSVNEQLIHGIPGKRRIREGDIVSIDVGAYYRGFHGDSAATFGAGRITAEARKLIDVTRQCFYDAAEAAKVGARIRDISAAMQKRAEGAGFNVVKQWTGHGIGSELHEDPEIPCFIASARGPRLTAGMTLAIEPMINAGGHEVDFADDGKTVVTCDGRICAHYEHTVLVTRNGYELLTYIEGLSV